MNDELTAAMREATELAQAGRFAEATAVVQRAWRQAALRSTASAEAARASAVTETRAPVRAGVSRGRYVHRDGARDFRLYVPAKCASGAASVRGLILMLHGCGQDPDDFAVVTRMDHIAEEEGLVVLYPIQAPSTNGAGCWNWHAPEHQGRERGEPAILAGMTRQVLESHGIERRPVYVAGFSAGGAMAMTLAATHPDLFSAVGVHSGLAYASASDVLSAIARMHQGRDAMGPEVPPLERGGIAAIVFQGDGDPAVHPSNAALIVSQILSARASARVLSEEGGASGARGYRRESYLDADGSLLVELWMIRGGGHGWFGGDPAGSFAEPDAPDASREMVRFFLRHPAPSG